MERLPKFSGPPEDDPSRRRWVALSPEGSEPNFVSIKMHPLRGTELRLRDHAGTRTIVSEDKADYRVKGATPEEDVLLRPGDSLILGEHADDAFRCYLENVDGRLNIADADRGVRMDIPIYVSFELRPTGLLVRPKEQERKVELVEFLSELDQTDLDGHSDFERAVHLYKQRILRTVLDAGAARYAPVFQEHHETIAGTVKLSDEDHGEAFNEAFFVVEDYCVTGGVNVREESNVEDEYPHAD